MKQIWKGKLKLRIAHECPYYATGAKRCEKVLFYRWGWKSEKEILNNTKYSTDFLYDLYLERKKK